MKDFLNPTELEKKHTPVIERIGGGEVLVRVGLTPHPMEEAHRIEWIELYRNKALVERKNLKVGEPAEAIFGILDLKPEDILVARGLCNIHGLWESV